MDGKPVCDDYWDTNDGDVVCRELGFRSLVEIKKQSYWGSVESVFSMDDVACTGSEDKLIDCPHKTTDNCGTGEGAGVKCKGNTLVTDAENPGQLAPRPGFTLISANSRTVPSSLSPSSLRPWMPRTRRTLVRGRR